MEEWIASSTVKQEDTGSNPARSFDDNHTNRALLALLPRICILYLHITPHLHPAIAYNHEFNIKLSLTAYIDSYQNNGVFAVQQEKEQQLLLVNYRVSALNGVGGSIDEELYVIIVKVSIN